jgi:DNA modification methylase
MVAFALRADGWYLRSDIIWSKKNPMPESVTDRPTKSHEYIFLLSKSAKYFYDADAVREITGNEASLDEYQSTKRRSDDLKDYGMGVSGGGGLYGIPTTHPLGRNKRSVWTVATAPYSGAHFATYPPELIEPCIKAGTSAKGECPKCGKAWVRAVEKEFTQQSAGRKHISGHEQPGANG